MKIDNVYVYGLENAVRISGFPMQVEPKQTVDETDFIRADKLANTPVGSGHGNFLSGVLLHHDVTASQVFWQQFQRYHFHQLVSSQSKMHRILKLDLAKSCNKYVKKHWIEELQRDINTYNALNKVGADKEELKEMWYEIVYNIPSGLELTVGISTNYLQLKTIYLQRDRHKLDFEWGKYCDWIETLPHSEWIIGKNK